MYRESWTINKTECWRIDAFELWCWRRLLTVPWTARRSNQSILKEINPEYSLEGLMLRLKFRYFGYLMRRVDSLEKAWCWERLKAGGEGITEDGHHELNGHEFEQYPGGGEPQGSLVRCSPRGLRQSDTAERLNWRLLPGTNLHLDPSASALITWCCIL